MRKSLAFAGCLVAGLVAVSPAAAQEEEARTLFEEGRAALNASRFGEARGLLERSLALHSRAPTAFNLALALHQLGEVERAVELCERVLGETYGPIDGDQRGRATEVCGGIREDLCHLEIEVAGDARAQVRIDGEPAGEVDPGGRAHARVDPGRHVITASAVGGGIGDERVVRLSRGERAAIVLRVSSSTSTPSQRSSDDDGAPAWVWWTAGGVAIAAAIAVAIVLIPAQEDPQPIAGAFPVTMTLTAP